MNEWKMKVAELVGKWRRTIWQEFGGGGGKRKEESRDLVVLFALFVFFCTALVADIGGKVRAPGLLVGHFCMGDGWIDLVGCVVLLMNCVTGFLPASTLLSSSPPPHCLFFRHTWQRDTRSFRPPAFNVCGIGFRNWFCCSMTASQKPWLVA